MKARRPLHHSARRALVIAALPVLLFSAACSSSAGSNQGTEVAALPEPSIEAAPVPASGYTAFLTAPLAPYNLTNDQTAVLWKAIRAKSIGCVQAKGFADYHGELIEKGDPPDGSADAITQPAGPWGYLGAKTAAERGFAPGLVSMSDLDPDAVVSEEVRDASRTCFEATSEEFSAPTAGQQLVKRLLLQAEGNTELDTRVAAARKQWVACMATAGFANANPRDLAQKQWRQNPVDEPAADEIVTAKADQKCTESSGLAKVYFPVNWGYQRELIDRNAQPLKEYSAALQALVAKAGQVAPEEDSG